MQLTLFHLMFAVMSVFVCIHVGMWLGYEMFGRNGAKVGMALGFIVGFPATSIPLWTLNRLTEYCYRCKSTEALKRKIIDVKSGIHGTYISCLIVMILLERGTPVEGFRGYIIHQLKSDDLTWRKAGWQNLTICYPELVPDLTFDDLFSESEAYRTAVAEIQAKFQAAKGQ